MSLSVGQTITACGPNIQASFQGIGGTPPYSYAVLANGAGGTINPTTGVYTAPATVPTDPAKAFDTIQVTDSAAAQATAKIQIGTPLILLCDIIQSQMGLANGRVYLWDQKIMQPTDSGLYVAVSVPSVKPFSNNTKLDPVHNVMVQYTNVQALIDIDIISRGPDARDRKEEVVLALNSIYSQQQQETNGFYIGKIPPGGRFVNLSQVDGAAIPYRYKISFNMQYFVTKSPAAQYIDTFQTVQVNTNP